MIKKTLFSAFILLSFGLFGIWLLCGQTTVSAETQNQSQIQSVVSTTFSDKSGWPIGVEYGDNNSHDINSTVTANLDEDSDLEVVFSMHYDEGATVNYRLFAYNPDGTAVSGEYWGDSIINFLFPAMLASGDIDADGIDEIVVLADDEIDGLSGDIYVMENDGSVKTGWPQEYPDGAFLRSPMIADYDADGALEVLIFGEENTFVYESDGSYTVSGAQCTSAAFADVDGDGNGNLVCFDERAGNGTRLFVYDIDGSQLVNETYPYMMGNLVSGDFDTDNMDEVMFKTRASSDSLELAYDLSTFYLVDENGAPQTGWPLDPYTQWGSSYQFSVGMELSIGDINGDSILEAVVASGADEIYAIDSTGSAISGYPITTYPNESGYDLILSDINGDGSQEMLFHNYQVIYAYDNSGTALAEYTLPVSPSPYDSGTIMVTDLESDGFVDIVIGTSDYIEVYEANDGIPILNSHWGTYGANVQRTYNTELSLIMTEEEWGESAASATSIGGVSTGDDGQLSILNGDGEDLYTCSIFESGSFNAELLEFDSRYYVFAMSNEESRKFLAINPINCEVVDSVNVSPKKKINEFASADLRAAMPGNEFAVVTHKGTKAKVTVYFFKDSALKKKAFKTVELGTDDWTWRVNGNKILLKSHGDTLASLKLIKKSGKYKLKEL
jgi:hypothetical protein